MLVRDTWGRNNSWATSVKYACKTILSTSTPPCTVSISKILRDLLQGNIWNQLEWIQESWVKWVCTGRKSVGAFIELRRVERMQLSWMCITSHSKVTVKMACGEEIPMHIQHTDSRPFPPKTLVWISLLFISLGKSFYFCPLPYPHSSSAPLHPFSSNLSLICVFTGNRDKV